VESLAGLSFEGSIQLIDTMDQQVQGAINIVVVRIAKVESSRRMKASL
jgi:hypothetical protein